MTKNKIIHITNIENIPDCDILISIRDRWFNPFKGCLTIQVILPIYYNEHEELIINKLKGNMYLLNALFDCIDESNCITMLDNYLKLPNKCYITYEGERKII